MPRRKGKQRRQFSIFSIINPLWVISSLSGAIFRFLGYGKTPTQRRNSLERIYFRRNRRSHKASKNRPNSSSSSIQIGSVRDSSPDTELPRASKSWHVLCEDKDTQTEMDKSFQSQLNSQLGELVKLRRFRNSLKPYSRHIRKLMRTSSEEFLKNLDNRNRERFGGKISKSARNRTAKMVRNMLMGRSERSTGGVNVDEAMDEMLSISDSEEEDDE